MRTAIGAVCAAMIGCAVAPPAPVAVRLGEDACGNCRMTIVSTATAAQIIAPGADPILFDELGCLRDYLRDHELDDTATTFVADHRTGAWVSAGAAIVTRSSTQTPMASGLIAHADAASRDADPAARGGTSIAAGDVFHPRTRSARP